MRRTLPLFAALVVAAAASGLVAAPPEPVKITIVHTNDLHAHIENAAAVAAVAREVRLANPNTLFLDAGDCVSGTPVSAVFRGEPVFEVMTLMRYDAGILGNHEFDHGWRQVARYRELAAHPLLNANARDPEGLPLGDAPSQVFEVGGVRVGVLGLLTDDMESLTTTANWKGCSVEPPIAAAKRLVPELRKKCDVVLLLTHVGVEVDAAIAGAVPGIDAIIGGHSHTELGEPIFVANGDARVPVAQARSNGSRVGILEFEVDPATRKARGFRGRLVKVDPAAMPNLPEVKQLVDQWQLRTEEKARIGEVIGSTPSKLTRERLRSAIESIYAELLGADFGYQNLSGIRDEIAKGEIRARDVWNVLPFENTLVKVRVRGAELPAYAKKRLGDALDPDRVYVIATNSYVGDQRRKYLGAADAEVEDTGRPMRDEVVAWVRAHGGFTRGRGPGRAPGEGEKR